MRDFTHIGRLKNAEAVVCDLDGTLYLDGHPYPQSIEFLNRVLESGRQLFYFTNNSSRSRKTYLEKLATIGFPVQDEFLITSADCAADYLNRNGLVPDLYLLGNQDLMQEFKTRGFRLYTPQDIRHGTIPKAVLLGFDTELTYEKIQVCYDLLIQNLPYVATHADILCPVKRNLFKPDVGSFIAMFALASGGREPIVTGKPSEFAVQTIVKKARVACDKVAFVGDRRYTDIRMADQNNMVGILVLSGETTPDMLKTSPDKPVIVAENVGDLVMHL